MEKDSAKPKVSVVMPVCNVENCLRECLDSVCNQTLNDIEIICVDDKSEDNSLEILREYQAKDSRFIIIENDKRSGAAVSRNIGIETAHGKYLSILDADDIFEKDMLAVAYEALEGTQADICGYDFWEFDDSTGDTIRRNNQPLGDILKDRGKEPAEGEMMCLRDIDDCFRTFYLGGAWQKLYRRSFVMENKVRFQTLPNANDTFFCSMTMALAERLVYIHRPLVHYRVNRQGQTIGKKNKHPLSLYRAFAHLYGQLLLCGCYEAVRREYNSVVTSTLIGFLGEMEEGAREVLYSHMLEDRLSSLGITHIGEEDFRYWREYWLALKFFESSSSAEILLAAMDAQAYWQDRRAWCFDKLRESGLSIALWGYGKLGSEWLQEAKTRGLGIRAIIDEDPAKQGLKVDGLEILPYVECPADVEVVVVTNPKFFPEILGRVRRPDGQRGTIDFHSYIYSDNRLLDCICK